MTAYRFTYLLPAALCACSIGVNLPSCGETDGTMPVVPYTDLENRTGLLPYESQYVGTYQPLLGWMGRTNMRWVDRQIGYATKALEDQLKRDLRLSSKEFEGGFTDPLPDLLVESRYGWLRTAIEGRSISPGQVRNMRDRGRGRSPRATLVDELLATPQSGNPAMPPPITQDPPTATPQDPAARAASELANAVSTQQLLRGFISRSVEDQAETYKKRLSWIDSIDSESPLGRFVVSPIGLIHLYRQYFFEFGTFLGPPVEHVWIAPGSKIELVEVNSQSQYRFVESESTMQLIEFEETESRVAEELSEQMTRESKDDLKVGISSEGGLNFGVLHGSVSSSVDYAHALSKSKVEARKQTSETKNKASSELRRTQRTLTRASTTTERISTRKHEIGNPTDELVNYELRRKYRKVGIQLQHLGTQLAWQFYLDEPGMGIGLAELVHVAKPEDFSTLPPADLAPPTFEAIETDYTDTIPYRVKKGDGDDNGTFKNGEKDDDKIQHIFKFQAPIPEAGYELSSVTQTDFQRTTPDHDRPSRWAVKYKVTNGPAGKFEATLKEVNFEKQPAVKVFLKLVWNATQATKTEAASVYERKMDSFDRTKQREAQTQLVEALRERVNLARAVRPRPEGELRDEERAILYRRAIDNLIGDEVGAELHASAEMIRTYFETEKMLYYVAPDWWNPRFDRNRGGITLPEIPPPGEELEDLEETPLSGSNRVRFGNEHANRENNYFITEESEPAPLGSSIGWLLQLDGDSHRNAFLNAGWAKVVVPIRRGFETAALEWLEQPHVEGADGLDATALDATGAPRPKLDASGEVVRDENGNPVPMTVKEAVMELAEAIAGETEEKVYLASQEMFQEGFQPLDEDAVELDEPFNVFSEWLEIVPTNQIAPVEYAP